jgi:hypothetical protein
MIRFEYIDLASQQTYYISNMYVTADLKVRGNKKAILVEWLYNLLFVC